MVFERQIKKFFGNTKTQSQKQTRNTVVFTQIFLISEFQ